MRRLLMQAVLCAALGLTVALAWWVDRTHAAAMTFKLGPVQRFVNKVASLDMRLPVGWKVKSQFDETGETALEVVEVKPRYGREREFVLRIHQIASHVPIPTAEDAATTVMETQPEARPAERFDFLGHAGVLIEYAGVDGDHGTDERRTPALCACAVIPDPRVVVSIELVGVRTFANADFDLIRSLAKALSLADPAHAVPLLPDTREVDWRAAPRHSGEQKKKEEPTSDNPDSQ